MRQHNTGMCLALVGCIRGKMCCALDLFSDEVGVLDYTAACSDPEEAH